MASTGRAKATAWASCSSRRSRTLSNNAGSPPSSRRAPRAGDKLAQFAAGLAQHVGSEDQTPRLIVARDLAPTSDAERARLSLAQRALVDLDCSDETRTVAPLARLRTLLALEEPVDERPPCPCPGLARFTAANRGLLFGRNQDKTNLVQRALAAAAPSNAGGGRATSALPSPGSRGWREIQPHRRGILARLAPSTAASSALACFAATRNSLSSAPPWTRWPASARPRDTEPRSGAIS